MFHYTKVPDPYGRSTFNPGGDFPAFDVNDFDNVISTEVRRLSDSSSLICPNESQRVRKTAPRISRGAVLSSERTRVCFSTVCALKKSRADLPIRCAYADEIGDCDFAVAQAHARGCLIRQLARAPHDEFGCRTNRHHPTTTLRVTKYPLAQSVSRMCPHRIQNRHRRDIDLRFRSFTFAIDNR